MSYTVDRILSDQPFWLTFTVEKSSGWKLPLDDVLELDGLTLHPAELLLSALDLQVYFQDEAEAAFSLYRDGTAPVLHLANGTDITTTWHGGRHLDSALPMVSFQTIAANGDPRGALTCFPPQKRRARFRARRFPLPGPGKSAMIVRDLSELSHAL